MKSNRTLVVIISLILPLVVVGQAEAIFNDIRLNQSFNSVSQKVTAISEGTSVYNVERPVFPLAKYKEQHLVCTQVKTKEGMISRVVFTFGDNKLKYIEARGNVLAAFASKIVDTASTYLGYDIYVEQKLFIKKDEDIARIMAEEATHINLFTWDNPYLIGDSKIKVNAKSSKKIPSFLKMGSPLDVVQPLLEANSNFTQREQLDGTDPNAQFQINCFGVEYLGFPRKLEARFGDNTLNVVWILTGKEEEDRIREALISQYGKPIYVTDDWEIFNNWQVGLRKDKPEILLMEQQLGLGYKTSYFKQ